MTKPNMIVVDDNPVAHEWAQSVFSQSVGPGANFISLPVINADNLCKIRKGIDDVLAAGPTILLLDMMLELDSVSEQLRAELGAWGAPPETVEALTDEQVPVDGGWVIGCVANSLKHPVLVCVHTTKGLGLGEHLTKIGVAIAHRQFTDATKLQVVNAGDSLSSEKAQRFRLKPPDSLYLKEAVDRYQMRFGAERELERFCIENDLVQLKGQMEEHKWLTVIAGEKSERPERRKLFPDRGIMHNPHPKHLALNAEALGALWKECAGALRIPTNERMPNWGLAFLKRFTPLVAMVAAIADGPLNCDDASLLRSSGRVDDLARLVAAFKVLRGNERMTFSSISTAAGQVSVQMRHPSIPVQTVATALSAGDPYSVDQNRLRSLGLAGYWLKSCGATIRADAENVCVEFRLA